MIDVPRMDEWLAELERLRRESKTDRGPEGFTGDELAAHLGIGHRAAMYKVKQWCLSGQLEYAGRRRVVNVVGSMSCIPVYRVKGAKR